MQGKIKKNTTTTKKKKKINDILHFPPLPNPKQWAVKLAPFSSYFLKGQIHFKDHQLGIKFQKADSAVRGLPAKYILSMGTDVRCLKQQWVELWQFHTQPN